MNEIVITPLGTISPYCKNDMNCPGYLIEYDNQRILLDCGNGITRLLNFPSDLNNLNIFITHYHKDHYSDIGLVQYASYVYHNLSLIKEPIKIYLPVNDYNFSKKEIISNQESYATYYIIDDNSKYTIGNIEISFKDNHSHSIESYMIKLQNKDFKIVYTSDIGNTNIEDLIDFCKDADIIICESSLLKKYNSNSKTHLTAYEAGMIAKLSNAKRLLLTHFWSEEEKRLYLEEAKINFKNTEVAKEGKKLILRRDKND